MHPIGRSAVKGPAATWRQEAFSPMDVLLVSLGRTVASYDRSASRDEAGMLQSPPSARCGRRALIRAAATGTSRRAIDLGGVRVPLA